MARTLIPGTRAYDDGLASPTCICASVRGECRQGRDCPVRNTELANETTPSSDFPTPERTRADDEYRARAWRWILAVDLTAVSAFALLVRWAARHAS